jgi:hypothetical protein
MDKRTILILHYHSTFENEPLLLCSGNRRAFEMNEKSVLKYLCVKLRYVESQDDEEKQVYAANDVSTKFSADNIKNEPMIDFPNQRLESNSFLNYPKIANEYLEASSSMKQPKKLISHDLIKTIGKKKLKKKKLKQRGSKHKLSSTCYIRNILDNSKPSN